MNEKTKRTDTKTLVLAALLTAMVVILQFVGASIRFGMFSISLVLIPIVVGGALCGVSVASWLGFVFGLVVLLSGDAAAFLAFSIPGTVITVILKGVACGYAAALTYKFVYSLTKRLYVAVIAAAIVCPVVNTAVFLLGCLVFFFNDIMPKDAGAWEVIKYMVFVLVGGNFLFELATNIILGPVVVRLINIRNK